MDAYSEDLRRKIVEALERRRMNQSEAARTFGVSLSSVKRYAKMADQGRSLAPEKRPGSKPKAGEDAKRLLAMGDTPAHEHLGPLLASPLAQEVVPHGGDTPTS
jgi:transposase